MGSQDRAAAVDFNNQLQRVKSGSRQLPDWLPDGLSDGLKLYGLAKNRQVQASSFSFPQMCLFKTYCI